MDRQLKYSPHYQLRNVPSENVGLPGPDVLRQPTTKSTDPLPTTYIQAATSNNTRKAYRMDAQHFRRWVDMLPGVHLIGTKRLHNFNVIALEKWTEYHA